MGVFTMCFASANMIGAPLGGFILATGGGSMLWGGTLVLGIVAAILYATTYRQMSVRPAVQEGYSPITTVTDSSKV